MENQIAPEVLAAKQQAHEQGFRDLLLGKRFDGCFVYTFQSRPADAVDDQSLLVFGGMDLVLDGVTMCIGFNVGMELLDLQVKEFAKLSGEVPITMLPRDLVGMLDRLEGAVVSNCSFRWMHYFELNEDFEPVEEPSFAPMEMLLEFDGGEKLQLAGIHFQLLPSGEMTNLAYHPEGALLISSNPWTEIGDAEPA